VEGQDATRYAGARQRGVRSAGTGPPQILRGGNVLERGRDVPEAVSEETNSEETNSQGLEREYTVVGIMEDGAALGQTVREIQDLGVGRDNLTVILKREDPDEPQPFPEGTRYIVVPDDRRGLEVPVGFGAAFLLFGIFFAVVVPSIGIPAFLVFVALAAVLLAGSYVRVGVQPILTDMEAPREESAAWNDEFEMGRALIFAVTAQRRLIRPTREAMQTGAGATYYIVDRRLEPRAVSQAVMHRAAPNEPEGSAIHAQGA
jgi:hypothetical protein